MRPLGTDDDDFELNYILDRNIRTSFAIVNAVETAECPPIVEDAFWSYQDKLVPPVNHTKMSSKLAEHPPKLHSYVELKNFDDDEASDTLVTSLIIDGKGDRKDRRERYVCMRLDALTIENYHRRKFQPMKIAIVLLSGCIIKESFSVEQ